MIISGKVQQICSEVKVKLSNAYYLFFFLLGHSNSTQYRENIDEVAMRVDARYQNTTYHAALNSAAW